MAHLHPILRAATDAKRRLLTSEQRIGRHIIDAYASTRARLSPHVNTFTNAYRDELARLQREQEDEDAPPPNVPLTWLHASGHLTRLQSAIRGELAAFGTHAEMYVTQGQVDATQQATGDAQAALRAPLPARLHVTFNRPNPDAITALIGRSTYDGKPLRALLDTLAPDASAAVQQALYVGLALGRNPRDVARDISNTLDFPRARALTIARTEMLGAYRDATSANYRANSDVLNGWIWLADLGPRCCALCCALNGTKHSLDEDMVSHSNCRCTQVPDTKSYSELLDGLGIDTSDIPDTTVNVPSGSDWFDEQDAGTQQAILGKSGYAAYSAGDLTLADLIGQDSDGGYYLKSLKQAGLDYHDYL